MNIPLSDITVISLVQTINKGTTFINHNQGKVVKMTTFWKDGVQIGLLADNNVANANVGFKIWSSVQYNNVEINLIFW